MCQHEDDVDVEELFNHSRLDALSTSSIRYFDLSHVVSTGHVVVLEQGAWCVCWSLLVCHSLVPCARQRTKNYAFDYKTVLNMKGNTAIFLLYAAARLSVRG